MTDDALFPDTEGAQKSPKLLWLESHGLTVRLNPAAHQKPWICSTSSIDFGCGDTEDEAIAEWAIANGKRLWNEPE